MTFTSVSSNRLRRELAEPGRRWATHSSFESGSPAGPSPMEGAAPKAVKSLVMSTSTARPVWQRGVVAGIVGLVISGGAFYVALSRVDLAVIRLQLLGVQTHWFFAVVVLMVGNLLLKAFRWKHIMAPVASIRLRDAASILAVGVGGNNLLPARLGEALRMWFLERNYGIAAGSSLGTIIVERFLDTLILLGALGTALNFAPVPAQFQRPAVVVLAGMVGCGMVLIVLAFRLPTLSQHVETFFPGRVGSMLSRILAALAEGLGILRGRGSLTLVVALSVWVWMNEILCVFMMLRMVHQPATLAWAACLVGITSLGSLVPAGPGYAGTYHLIAQQTLMALGVPASDALGIAVLIHTTGYVVGTPLGIVCCLRELRRQPSAKGVPVLETPKLSPV